LPEELALRAAELGQGAIALTDHDGLWGAMEMAQAAKAVGVRAITGAEMTVTDGLAAGPDAGAAGPDAGAAGPDAGRVGPSASDPTVRVLSPHPARATRGRSGGDPPTFHVTLLVEDADGYRNLCRLVTEAHRATRPRPDRDPLPPVLPLQSLEERSEGLVCLSGCARDGALAGRWERGEGERAIALGRRLRDVFGRDRFRVELQRPFWRWDRARNRWLAGLAERLGVGCVATGNVHMHDRSRARLQDALTAVRLHGTLEETEPRRRGNGTSYLCSAAEAAARFADHPDAIAETTRLAERLPFDLTRDLGYHYPGSEDPDADRALAEICRARLEHRYGGSADHSEAERRLEEELGVIRKLELSGFFLLHYDLLELAREVAAEVRGPDSARMLLPPGRGRGSSVSSVVCYLTGLSHIDPVRGGLFLGRFLNEEITEAPDIDLDFPRDIREKLIPRVHERYGPDRSALVSAFACYRSRGAVRDFGKVLGLPVGEIERAARMVDVYDRSSAIEDDVAEAIGAGRARSVRWRALAEVAQKAWGLPRHASQHPGGMVLSTRPLVDICPVQPAAMEGRQIVQWDKDSCADAGFLKIDLLGLGMLSAVERCVDEIARARGERIDLSRIPLDDKATYDAIQRADTTGVFQIESRAQMQMLTRTLPESLDDLTVQVALVRPGPIQGGAVHPYLERRERLRADPSYEIPYEHPSLEPILRDTLGTIVFQEQVIQVAMALAGFSPGEAEGLRRAMSRKRSEEAILTYRDRFLAGAVARGVACEVADRVFEQVHGFSGFGFPKAHAAAFGLLAYQSTWLRVHYGPELLCSLLNEQPMGFYPPDALVHEAQRRGIEVLPPDVNVSGAECAVESAARSPQSADPPSADCGQRTARLGVRIGLGYINGLREDEARAVVAERERGGAYRSLGELASRFGGGRDALERLAWAGACDSLATTRRAFSPPIAGKNAQRPVETAALRRPALWRLGVATGARHTPGGEQLALPLEAPPAPRLRQLGGWELAVADYESTGMTLGAHPMRLIRPSLDDELASSLTLPAGRNRSSVRVAGMVIARQRPATANGVLFMLLEDEWGTINLIVPPPVYRRDRLVARAAPFVLARGRLERAGANLNVVVARLERLDRPDLPLADVKHIEPPRGRESGRRDESPAPGERRARRLAAAGGGGEMADLEAALPPPHSFGRRGR
jgi:error-prone DNA polymerase